MENIWVILFSGTFILLPGVLLANPLASSPVEPLESICHRFNRLNPPQEPQPPGLPAQPKCRSIGKTLYWEGAITDDTVYEIQVLHPDIMRLELNSFGGDADAALRIAQVIRDRNIETNVRKGAWCASACTLLFQAGTHRTAHPSVSFLYHSARLEHGWFDAFQETCPTPLNAECQKRFDEIMSSSQEHSRMLFQEYVRYGASPAFVEKYFSLPQDPNWFEVGNFSRGPDWIVKVPDLVQYGIVQGFDLRDAVPEENEF